MTVQVVHLRLGDCVEVLQKMQPDSVGAIVTDPPYGLEFMNKEWDKLTAPTGGASFKQGKGRFLTSPLPSYTADQNPVCLNCKGTKRGNDRKGFKRCRCDNPEFPNTRLDQSLAMRDWHARWLQAVYRVLIPGGVAKVFGATRTFHRLAQAMSDVGFILETGRSLEAWSYGSGFPKSLDLAKAIDKYAGSDPDIDREIQDYLRERREVLGLTKSAVDQMVYGGTTQYSWVEGRGGMDANTTRTPAWEDWVALKKVLQLDDRYDDYIRQAIPSKDQRRLIDGGRGGDHWD